MLTVLLGAAEGTRGVGLSGVPPVPLPRGPLQLLAFDSQLLLVHTNDQCLQPVLRVRLPRVSRLNRGGGGAERRVGGFIDVDLQASRECETVLLHCVVRSRVWSGRLRRDWRSCCHRARCRPLGGCVA